MSKTVKELAREACGCCICEGTHSNFDCHACFCGVVARPPYNCHAERIERAFVEHEKTVREEYTPFVVEMATSAHMYDSYAIMNKARDMLATRLLARKPADTEVGA